MRTTAALVVTALATVACSSKKETPLVYIECTRQHEVFEHNYFIDETNKQVIVADLNKKPLGQVTIWDEVLIEVKTKPVSTGLAGDQPHALLYRFDRRTGAFFYRVEDVNKDFFKIGTCEQKPPPQNKF